MIQVLRNWFDRYLSDEEAVVLLIFLVVVFAIILTLGNMLAPVIAGVIFAFLMDGLVSRLSERKVPHLVSVSLVFALFMAALLSVLLVILPLAWNQVTALFQELPRLLKVLEERLAKLSAEYPTILPPDEVTTWVKSAGVEVGQIGQWVLSTSLASIPGLVAVMIYLVLVPMLVFFFMKDKEMILAWFARLLPGKRKLMTRVWVEMNEQVANYVRGKAMEILIVGVVTYVAFALMGLKYATLLGVLVGMSVIVPYIGAAVVTIPVAIVGFLQWGWGGDFVWLMVVYGIIQALDGNVLVPLLFSEVVNLHPVAIIVAVLVFGGLWGFWGVFFAIPLATLIKAVMTAWPRSVDRPPDQAPGDGPPPSVSSRAA